MTRKPAFPHISWVQHDCIGSGGGGSGGGGCAPSMTAGIGRVANYTASHPRLQIHCPLTLPSESIQVTLSLSCGHHHPVDLSLHLCLLPSIESFPIADVAASAAKCGFCCPPSYSLQRHCLTSIPSLGDLGSNRVPSR